MRRIIVTHRQTHSLTCNIETELVPCTGLGKKEINGITGYSAHPAIPIHLDSCTLCSVGLLVSVGLLYLAYVFTLYYSLSKVFNKISSN